MKNKIRTKELCREFYEYGIFGPTSDEYFFYPISKAGSDVKRYDSSFKPGDWTAFIDEMSALQIELFGLAWSNYLFKLSESDKLDDKCIGEEIIFTKRYLEQQNALKTWQLMKFYNSVIQKSGIDRRGEDKIRAEILSDWGERLKKQLNLDTDCVERFIARCYGDYWQTGILSQKLTVALMERLECQLNLQATFKLQEVIIAMYNRAMDFIETVAEWGSWERSLEITDNVRSHIMGALRAGKFDKYNTPE